MYIKEALTYYNKLHGKKVTMQQAANEIATIYNKEIEKGVNLKPVKGNTLHNYISQHLSKKETSKDFLNTGIVHCMCSYFEVVFSFMFDCNTVCEIKEIDIRIKELIAQEEELVVSSLNSRDIKAKAVELLQSISDVQEQIKRMQELKEWLIEIGKN